MKRFVRFLLGLAFLFVLAVLRGAQPGAKFGAFLFRRRVMKVWLGGAAIFAFVWLYIAFSSPRMRDQPHFGPYQLSNEATFPSGTLPVETSPLWPTIDTVKENARVQNGKVYYGYYCVFCHGENGKGEGPVGLSFIPSPTDLTSPTVQSLNDSAIIRVMVSGTGHQPLLPPVLPPQDRPAIAAYVHTLGRAR